MQTQEKMSVTHVEMSKVLKDIPKMLFCKLCTMSLDRNMNEYVNVFGFLQLTVHFIVRVQNGV